MKNNMKQITNYIQEGLKINSKTKVNSRKYHPKDKNELKELIKQLLDERGKDADLNDIDTSNITDMSGLFKDLDPHNIDISQWDVSNVESMNAMFQNCKYLKTVGDLGKWDIRNVLDMSWMFNGCINLTEIGDLDNWEINDTKMKYAFQDCKKLKSIGFIEHWRPREDNWEIFPLSGIRILPRKRI